MRFPLLRYICSDSFRKVPHSAFLVEEFLITRVLVFIVHVICYKYNQNSQVIFHAPKLPSSSYKETKFIMLVICKVQGKLFAISTYCTCKMALT